MTYRQEIEKIYKKLDSLAQRGVDAYLDFREYIDELIDYGQYSIFDDVMLTKYNIDIKKYNSVEDLKKNVFSEIRFQTTSKFLKNLKKLYISKAVYNTGVHFYNVNDNKYLGDISEINPNTTPQNYFQDPRLSQRIGSTPYLQVVVGLSSSIYDAIPEYNLTYINGVISYVTYSQVVYNKNVYECINSYNWSYGNPITPTYSNYWTFSTLATYSVSSLTSSELSLLDKYSDAIDTLKSLN
jgi:hypothetical protein